MHNLKRLTRDFLENNPELPEGLTVGTLEDLPEKVVQFGEGNFMRAFVDWMFDSLNAKGLFNGRIAVVQPIKLGIAHLLEEQNGLYTLLTRAKQNGEVIDERHIVTSVSRGINAYEHWDKVIKLAQAPEVRYMLSNTTEAGIVYKEEAQPVGNEIPDSFPAKVCTYLFERYTTFNGAPDKGMVLMPCELIDRNGDKLKRYVVRHASKWGLEKEFTAWINEHCYFLNTLVDRIVPGYPREDAETLCKELGYKDQLLDVGEVFHLWVIEGPKELAEELPFDKIGLNVVWTDDMTPYRTRKVRMLNGAHTSSVLGSYLAGVDTVGEMLNDKTLNAFLEHTLLKEISPIVPGDSQSNLDFGSGILERFNNPFVKHELLSISLNSVSKWKVRVLPSLQDYMEVNKQLPKGMAFSLAALIAFYHGVGCAAPELRGDRNNANAYSIKDDIDILAFFEKRWHAFHHNHDIRVLVGTILANENLWGTDLTLVPNFLDAITSYLQSILFKGMRSAIEEVVQELN